MIPRIDKSWTLFLDRDGVINKKIENGYVKEWSEFSFLDGSIEAISKLSNIFGVIIVVTNQRGVGKGLMTLEKLNEIHNKMVEVINDNSGRIDGVYFCTDILNDSVNRKPNVGMAIMAKTDFPEIDFKKSLIVGDSMTDMQFGFKLGMTCLMIEDDNNININNENIIKLKSLIDFANVFDNGI